MLLSWHIAETREKAIAEAREGLLRHHNEYIVGTLQRPGAKPFKDPDEAIEKTAFSDGAAATIGTPDDLVARIKSVLEISGGFGTVVGFVHDWANPENTMRSWDMVARYVVPEINGYLAGLRAVAALRRHQPRRLRPRQGSDHGQDQRERGRGRRARGDARVAARRCRLGQQRPRSGQGAARPGGSRAGCGVRLTTKQRQARFGHPVPRSSLTISRVARISMPRYA